MAKYSSCAALADAQLAEPERGEQRRVVGQDAQLALDAGADRRHPRSSAYASRSGVTISSWSGIVALPGASLGQLGGVLADVVDRAGEEEGLLRQVVGLALEDLLEGGDGVLDGHVLARRGR